MKPVSFCGSSLDELRAFPAAAKRECGFQIDRLQRGLEPADWKPFASVGPGVAEIRVTDAQGIFRVMYVAKFSEAIYILHCFQKKSQKTARSDIDVAKKQYSALVKERKK
jgi:phage-related protein